jgi:hypothetical protein
VIVTCERCGTALTGPLLVTEPAQLADDTQDGAPTLAPGLVVRDPQPVLTWTHHANGPTTSTQHSPADCAVVHPDSTQNLRTAGTDNGCCGSDGLDGPNRACTGCGLLTATARTDCWTAHEVRFLPHATTLIPEPPAYSTSAH